MLTGPGIGSAPVLPSLATSVPTIGRAQYQLSVVAAAVLWITKHGVGLLHAMEGRAHDGPITSNVWVQVAHAAEIGRTDRADRRIVPHTEHRVMRHSLRSAHSFFDVARTLR